MRTRLAVPRPSQIENTRGSALILGLIAVAVVSILALASASLFTEAKQTQTRLNFYNLASQVQLTIRNSVNDPKSWETTIGDSAHNATLACLKTRSCTTPQASAPFVLWPAGAPSDSPLTNAVYDGTSPTAGYTLGGDSCDTFSLSGNGQCPLHVVLRWSTVGCSPAPCDAPVTIQADLIVRAGPLSPLASINDANFTLSFNRVAAGQASSCAGSIPPSEATLCASPPQPGDQLICTATGFRCGRVFY